MPSSRWRLTLSSTRCWQLRTLAVSNTDMEQLSNKKFFCINPVQSQKLVLCGRSTMRGSSNSGNRVTNSSGYHEISLSTAMSISSMRGLPYTAQAQLPLVAYFLRIIRWNSSKSMAPSPSRSYCCMASPSDGSSFITCCNSSMVILPSPSRSKTRKAAQQASSCV